MFNRILFMGMEASMAVPFLLPASLLLNKYRFHDLRRTGLYFLFSFYLAAMYAVAGLPNILHTAYIPRFNLQPFLYMFSDWENTLLNLLLFIPLGLFLSVLWEPFHKIIPVILMGFGTSALIEILQLFSYRATDINDLMTNTAGTILGFGAAGFLRKYCCPVLPQKDAQDLPLLYATVFLIMYFFQPPVSLLLRSI